MTVNEFIPFKSLLSWHELEESVKSTGCPYRLSPHFSLERRYKGFSDGRNAEANTVCFVDRIPAKRTRAQLEQTLVITTHALHQHFPDAAVIYTDDPRALFIALLEIFERENRCSPFSSQVDAQTSEIHPDALVDPKAIIENGVKVGKGSVISAGCVLKRGTVIGRNCIIRENCVIGCNGIALYKTLAGATLRFPHLAGVFIGDEVELGAGVVVVRGTLTNTTVGDETVIGNLCNIGHGVHIGQKVWMSVGSLIGGNCSIGNHVTIGLGVRLRDNLKIGTNVSIGMGSVVTKDIPSDISVFGNPAKKIRSLTTGPKR